MRQCSKAGCSEGAVATLTYDYQESTAVLGPLSTHAQPHTFDLCDAHAQSLTVPRGWQVIRLQSKFDPAPPSHDDLLALVEAIRETAGKPAEPEVPEWTPVQEAGPFTRGADKYAPLRREGQFQVIPGDAE